MRRREDALFAELSGAVGIAFGSPSLMGRAARLLAASRPAFERLKQAAEEYRTGKAPSEQELLDFLEYVAIDQLLGLLSQDERELLRRTTLFEVPVPVTVIELLHPKQETAPAAGTSAVKRLLGLGLLNRFENPLDFRRGHDHALADALVRPKL